MGDRFPIVVVGASAGGLEAARELFEHLPADAGIAFVLVLHLDPTRESLVDKVIRAHTGLAVQQAQDGLRLEPNRVHVAPPGHLMAVRGGVLKLTSYPPSQHDRLPINHILQSLAEDQHERAVAVILSGSGADGADGAREVVSAGGVVIAQDPATARFDGMPRSAIATGIVDYVLAVAEIPAVLLRLARTPRGGVAVGEEMARLPALLGLLHARLGFDFEGYKRRTLLRRIHRRMGLRLVDSLAQYVRLLRDDVEECRALARDFLIGVTEFFREPEAWQELEKMVVEPMVRNAVPGRPIRVWVAGCATGEEAYAMAMIFLEHIHQSGRAIGLQVFASDVSEEALATARAGRYGKGIVAHVSPARVRRFFAPIEREGGWRVRKELRDVVVFAAQNLFADPPYSRMDLICCRNLLIYLEPDIQRRVLSLFEFALKPEGCLFLGPAENLGDSGDAFLVLSKKWRVFRRAAGQMQRVVVPVQHKATRTPAPTGSAERDRTSDGKLAGLAQQIVLERFAPAAVLVNQRNEMLHLSGPTDLYLRQPRGTPTLDLLHLVREGLTAGVREALASTATRSVPVEIKNLGVKRGTEVIPVRITAMPVPSSGHEESPVRLVVFEEDRRPHSGPASRVRAAKVDVVRQLESDLMVARGDLKTSLEQLDSSNEEFRAANEEVMSINEELQATNEELETSREELQSMNEELSTVNSQLQAKVSELEQANNDLGNLLSSAEIATLCLDREQCIKWFTPPITSLLRLLPGDRGRSIRDFATRFRDGEMLQDIAEVTRTLVPAERMVRTDDQRWFIQRVLPYRTEQDRIEGVVITFVDVTNTRKAEADLEELNEALERRVEIRTRALQTMRHAAVIANEAPSLEQAILEILALLCGESPWALGHALLVERESPTVLVDSGVWWRAPSYQNRSFQRAVRGARYRPGSDPVGRVIATGEHLWLRDLSETASEPWVAAARNAGLRCALLLPLHVEHRTVGTLKLLSDRPVELDDAQIEVMQEIASHLARSVERSRFAIELSNLADAERGQIARELHDGIGQRLAGLGMLASSLRQDLASGSPEATRADELRHGIEETKAEVRTVSRGLLPIEVSADGLASALEDLAAQIHQPPQLDCQFVYRKPVRLRDDSGATQLYRIAQEAARNAVDHAHPRHVTISLEQQAESVVLTVRDDGTGIQPMPEDGAGIRIMRHRAGLIGGKLNIASADAEGTIVTCVVRGTLSRQEGEA